MLTVEKLPALFTLILGVFSWSLTHIVNRVLERPLIEISHSTTVTSGATVHHYRLRNLTSKVLFHDLTFALTLSEKERTAITAAVIAARPPAMQGDVPPTFGNLWASLPVAHLQPGGEVELSAMLVGPAVPVLSLSKTGGQAVFLAPASFLTRLVRFELEIVGGVFVVAIVLVVVYMLRLARAPSGARKADAEG